MPYYTLKILGRNRIKTTCRTDPGGAYMRDFQESALAFAGCPSWLGGVMTHVPTFSDINNSSV